MATGLIQIPKDAKIVAAIFGQAAGTTYVTIGGGGRVCIVQADEKYFTYDSSTGYLTCQIAGSYTTYIYARGCFNSNGNEMSSRYRLYYADTLVKSGSYARAGGTTSYTANVAVGETIYLTASISSGSTYINAGFIVVKD